MPDELVVVTREPLNAETPLDRLSGAITPVGRHYVRNHFAIPPGPGELEIDGALARPLTLTVDDLRAMPSRSFVVTLECAGNGRAFLEPPCPGEPWRLGAVGTAKWTGVPLRALLERAALYPSAVEVLFRGSDEGVPVDLGRRISYDRSLPARHALEGDVLVAYAMNGAPLAPEHGAPLRLVVPGWYGMASVKWLRRITALDRPFTGFYQTERYVIDGLPLRATLPRAVIVSPKDGERLTDGELAVRGYAWSGRAPLERVDLSVDGGEGWYLATLGDAESPHAWREWRCAIQLPRGSSTLLARAHDGAGSQPTSPRRNALGYANNAARPVRVVVA